MTKRIVGCHCAGSCSGESYNFGTLFTKEYAEWFKRAIDGYENGTLTDMTGVAYAEHTK